MSAGRSMKTLKSKTVTHRGYEIERILYQSGREWVIVEKMRGVQISSITVNTITAAERIFAAE
jgi:hypothetical protein